MASALQIPENAPAEMHEAMDSLMSLVNGMGGPDDSRAIGARNFSHRRKNHKELIDAYEAHWMTAKMVEIPAFEMTRARREFMLKDPDQIKELLKAEDDLSLWERARECTQWSYLLGGGAILLGLDGHGEMDVPLDVTKVQKGQLKFLHALDPSTLVPWGAEHTFLIQNPTSPEFMRPEFYTLNAAGLEFIHHTRIVRFPGVPLPWLQMVETLWWGGSRIDRTFDAIADAEAVLGSVVALLEEAQVDVYSIVGLFGKLATKAGTEEVIKRVQLANRMKSNYQAILKDQEEDYEQKQNSIVQGMGALIQQFLVVCAAASDIPVTRLVGTSADGMNATGEGDARNFYDMIDAQRANFLRPRLCELDEVFVRSTLGSIPEDYSWEYGPLWQMSDTEIATIQAQRATRDATYLDQGIVTPSVVAKELQADKTYGAIDDKYIAELEVLEKLPPEDRDELDANGNPKTTEPEPEPKPEAKQGEAKEEPAAEE